MAKIFDVYVEYTMSGKVRIVADSIEEACEIAENRKDDIPLNAYKNDEYVNGSYVINHEFSAENADDTEDTTLPVGHIIDVDTE